MREIQLLTLGLVLILIPPAIAVAQEPKGLNDSVRLQVHKARVGNVLARIAVRSEISIGFERSDSDERTQP